MASVVHIWTFLLGISLCSLLCAQGSECEDVMSEAGTGSMKEVYWSYDVSQDECQPFLYHGEGKSRNRFETDQECMSRCSMKYSTLYPIGGAVCDLSVDGGPCMARILMWFYNNQTGTCDTFFYGGCHGNGNRFSSKSDCGRTCVTPEKGKSGTYQTTEGQDLGESSANEGLIISVMCSCVFGIAFIVSLSMFLVQRKKRMKEQHKITAVEMK